MSFLGVCPLEPVLTRGSGLSGLLAGGGEDLNTSIMSRLPSFSFRGFLSTGGALTLVFFTELFLQPLSNLCRALTLYESVEQWLDVLLVGFAVFL